MEKTFRVLPILTTAILAATGAVAQAQDLTFSLSCQFVGVGPPEALGDRDGHAISTGTTSCRADNGPLSGGVMTGMTMYEWDKGNGVLLAGSGIVRKPGATSAYQITEGKIKLVMADGKVTGTIASGKGIYNLATGSAASLAGKTFTYSTQPTGPGQFALNVKVE